MSLNNSSGGLFSEYVIVARACARKRERERFRFLQLFIYKRYEESTFWKEKKSGKCALRESITLSWTLHIRGERYAFKSSQHAVLETTFVIQRTKRTKRNRPRIRESDFEPYYKIWYSVTWQHVEHFTWYRTCILTSSYFYLSLESPLLFRYTYIIYFHKQIPHLLLSSRSSFAPIYA